jgi:Fe-S oxidoreductase
MDDRTLFRYGPNYQPSPIVETLNWSEFGGFLKATEMCNNNGHCRKSEVGVMCPSYRATLDEQHLTRGRANSLRLALSGQLGEDALVSPMMKETMDLCIGCKGCRRECPTGVDMSRLKLEFLNHYNAHHGHSFRNNMVSHFPRYAPLASKFGFILNIIESIPFARFVRQTFTGFSWHRTMPNWHSNPYFGSRTSEIPGDKAVYLFTDCFNRWFEPENARAAENVLRKVGYEVFDISLDDDARPLCCGRTFLSVGMVEKAREEARRLIDAIRPSLQSNHPVIGLEPSCLLTLRDEYSALFSKDEIKGINQSVLLFHEFMSNYLDVNSRSIKLKSLPCEQVIYHGHCHEKAFGLTSKIESVLEKIPGLYFKKVPGGCCGMAGAFGYEKEHYEISKKISNVGPLPHIKDAGENVIIIANGTSCRHQFDDLAKKKAVHIARVVDMSLESSQG